MGKASAFFLLLSSSGVISKEKMKQILTMRGSDPLDDKDADEMLDQLPFDEDGSLDCSSKYVRSVQYLLKKKILTLKFTNLTVLSLS